jgi:hypothetical protein
VILLTSVSRVARITGMGQWHWAVSLLVRWCWVWLSSGPQAQDTEKSRAKAYCQHLTSGPADVCLSEAQVLVVWGSRIPRS